MWFSSKVYLHCDRSSFASLTNSSMAYLDVLSLCSLQNHLGRNLKMLVYMILNLYGLFFRLRLVTLC